MKLLTTIKNCLNDFINRCELLNDDEKINNKILEAKQSVIDMTEQIECYVKLLTLQSNTINNLQLEIEILKNDIFTSKFIIKFDIFIIRKS